jgi:3-oxoadipate enol-lactonase
MATAATAGARLHYERAGAGPPLLYVSGSGSDLRRPPSPFAWPGAAGFDLVAYDHRGLGRSRVDGPQAQPQMADFAADALALADQLGWERFLLLGVSFGGMVAQEVAIRAPARVIGLVLACTSSGGAGGASAPLHELAALPPPERLRRLIALADRRAASDPAIHRRLAALLEPLSTDAAADPRLRAGNARQLEARRHHDTHARLGAIAAPTLVAAGHYDELAPLANSQALAAAIPGARLEVFEGGHGFLHEDARAWPVVAEFLLAQAAASSRSTSSPSQASTKLVVSGESPTRTTSGAR